jgi:hypothetical protein
MWCLTKTVAVIVGLACGLMACQSAESPSAHQKVDEVGATSIYDPALVAGTRGAAFVVETDVAAMRELGIARPDDPYLPFFYAKATPRVLAECGSESLSRVVRARTAYYRLDDEPTQYGSYKRLRSIVGLTSKEDWEPFLDCVRRTFVTEPETFGQLEGVRVQIEDPRTCKTELEISVFVDGPLLYVGNPELIRKQLSTAMRDKATARPPTELEERWSTFSEGKIASAILSNVPNTPYQLAPLFPAKEGVTTVLMGLDVDADTATLRAVVQVPRGDSKEVRGWVNRFIDAAELVLDAGRAAQPEGDLVARYGEESVGLERRVATASARELALADSMYLRWRMRAAEDRPRKSQVATNLREYSLVTAPVDIPKATSKSANVLAGPIGLDLGYEYFNCEDQTVRFGLVAGYLSDVPNLNYGGERIRYSVLGLRDRDGESVMHDSCPEVGKSRAVSPHLAGRSPAGLSPKEGVSAADVAFVDGVVTVDFPTRIERVTMTDPTPGEGVNVNGTSFEVVASFGSAVSFLVSGKVSNLLEVRALGASGQAVGGREEAFRKTDRGYLGTTQAFGELSSVELFLVGEEYLAKFPFELPVEAAYAPRDADVGPPVFEPFSMQDFRRKVLPKAARHLNGRKGPTRWFDRKRVSGFDVIATTDRSVVDIYIPPMPNVVGTFGQFAFYIDSVRLQDGTRIASTDHVEKGKGGHRTKWDQWFDAEPTWSGRLRVEQGWQGPDDPITMIRHAGGLGLRVPVEEFSARLEFRIPTTVQWHALAPLRAGESVEIDGFEAHVEQVSGSRFALHVVEGARRVVAVYAVGGALKAPKPLSPRSVVPTSDTWTVSFYAPEGAQIFLGVADDFETETQSITFRPKLPTIEKDATKRR